MAGNEIKGWAAQFARDLGEGNTRILFERVLARHVQKITVIRASGLSWPSIASILALGGVRRVDGRLISSDHLRAAYSRVYAKEHRKERHAHKTTATGALPTARFRRPHNPDSVQSDGSNPNPRPPTSSNHRVKHTAPSTPSLKSGNHNRAGNLRAAMQRAQNLRGKLSNE